MRPTVVRLASTKPAPKAELRDEGIRAPLVRLVDPAIGQLNCPYTPRDIVAKIDRKEFYLLQVAAGAPAAPQKTEWTLDELPICRLVSKREEYQKQRDAKKAKSTQGPPKDVQLTWNVSSNDLAHKLSKARRELERGTKVRVLIVSKKGTRRVLPGSEEEERRTQLVHDLQEELCRAAEGTHTPMARLARPAEWRNQRTLVEMLIEPLAGPSGSRG